MRRILIVLPLAVLAAASGLAACISDDAAVTRPPAKNDSGSATDASQPGDGGISTCSVPKDKGIDCFGGTRCTALGQTCCVSLQGGDTLVGMCIDKGDSSVTSCKNIGALLWECDRAKDCASGGSKCCLPDVFTLADRAVCPAKLVLDGDAGAPKGGKVSYCTQNATCGAGVGTTACESDGECSSGQKCTPVVIQEKVLGACLPPR
jgi:hypothetical protein